MQNIQLHPVWAPALPEIGSWQQSPSTLESIYSLLQPESYRTPSQTDSCVTVEDFFWEATESPSKVDSGIDGLHHIHRS